MKLKDSSSSYGAVSVIFHWLSAIVIVGLFVLGLWMTDLNYYSSWYQTAPHLHKSIGFLLICFVIARLIWRLRNQKPDSIVQHKTWERVLARWIHRVFYLLILCLFPTGYLITTAKGQGLEIFNWFTLPALVTGIENLEDLSGEIHEWIAYVLIGLVVVHALGALKHHFWDRDETLIRMFGVSQRKKDE